MIELGQIRLFECLSFLNCLSYSVRTHCKDNHMAIADFPKMG
jgi:hypothetical protein